MKSLHLSRFLTTLTLLFPLGAAAAPAELALEAAEPTAPERTTAGKLLYRMPRAHSEIRIDGILQEEAWRHALVVRVDNEIDPGKNVPAPVRTIAYLAYDSDKLYAAFRAYDPDPSAIRANLADRDTPFRDDFVGLFLDTFNDERRGFEIFVNPLGVQMDLSLDETADEEEDAAWDAIWQSAGRIDEQGYTVEIAIPFSSLRFQRAAGEQIWGLGTFRSYPRSRRHQITATTVDPDDNCLLCQIPKVTGFEGVTPGRNIELDPTLTAHRTDAREDFPRGSIEDGDPEGNLGLTARWGITPNLILSGALNPDFSQVEADVAQFDVNSQFALFYPEKRPFFLEGADFFETPFNVVHTRTVVDPSWGAKLTGKEGRHGIGVFVAQDDASTSLLPSSQSSRSLEIREQTTNAALRYRFDLGASSTLGAVMTHRAGGDYSNDVFGIDGRWRPTPSDVVNVHALGSRTEYPGGAGGAGGAGLPEGQLDGAAWRVGYNHGTRNWSWYARYEDIDPEFRADLGFMPQVGYTLGLAGLEHTWWAEKRDGWWTSFTFGGDWDQTDDADGNLLERELETWIQLRGPMQSFYMIDTGRRDRFWNGVTFDERFTHFEMEMRPTGNLDLGLASTVADTIDFAHTRAGDLLRIRPWIGYNFGRHLRMTASHDLQRVTVRDEELLEVNLSELRAVYQINIRTFVRATFQYEDFRYNQDLYTAAEVPSQDEHLFSQLLFSYKLNPQTVLFLGYSDNQVGGEVRRDEIVDLTRADRTLFFKVGYALVM